MAVRRTPNSCTRKTSVPLPEFASLVDKMRVVNNWFSTHLQAGGRATLSKLQRQLHGKESAPLKPGKTREWNGQVACAEWHVANRDALTRLVTEAGFDTTKENAAAFKAVILDLDSTFWPRLPHFITLISTAVVSWQRSVVAAFGQRAHPIRSGSSGPDAAFFRKGHHHPASLRWICFPFGEELKERGFIEM